MMNIKYMLIINLIFLLGCEEENIDLYQTSEVSYKFIDQDVGCGSKYSDEKKNDVFNEKYNNHWMQWTGEVMTVNSDGLSLNIDGVGTQDLRVELLDNKSGYNIEIGEKIKVKFVMKRIGGCILPFSGQFASIVK